MRKVQRRFFCRKFLNRPGHHSIGLIHAWVRYTETEHTYAKQTVPTPSAAIDASLTIGDCQRSVTLDFDFDLSTARGNTDKIDHSDLASVRNVRHKAKLLRDEINKFCETVLIACDDAETYVNSKIDYNRAMREVAEAKTNQ